ncbi:MAG: Mn(2+) uptake NRAMP transporter MntH [Phycisphaera sp.]|nr:Mn(2+) uptake NRAMP transporter MntH [Phycisphaera sp.]
MSTHKAQPAPAPHRHGSHKSLEDVHRTVALPMDGKPWWRRLFMFAGPAYMVSVGYMDPGNWATDIEGGARFGYTLIWVLLMSNMMAVLLQTLSARLGLVTGKDLAQACREAYSTPIRWILFVLCEIAIAACDLAELLGTAIGLNLLFGIPLEVAVIVTAFDVLVLLALQRWGIRKMEAFIVVLVFTIGLCFIIELFLSKPSFTGIASGFVPRPLSGEALYIAIGMLGATVMPHNLYLHSALVQSRDVHKSKAGIAQACRYNLIDSAVALNAAFFVNAGILVVSAATFWSRGIVVNEIQQAHSLLDNVLGTTLAPVAFAVALICAGQSSTLTGTLAGQITMEGFLHFKMRPWLRRLITRSLAIVPAVIVIYLMGDRGTYKLLILSQVILSMQLPFAVIPLVRFTSSKVAMGPFANTWWVKALAWVVTAIIVVLNIKLVYEQIVDWSHEAGDYRGLVLATVVPISAGLGLLLAWMTFRPERVGRPVKEADAEAVARAAMKTPPHFKRIGVALEAGGDDAVMLAEAVALARAHGAELVLMHVVEGVGGQWYGQQADDAERRHDELYMEQLAERLNDERQSGGLRAVRSVLGYGDVPKEVARMAREEKVDLIVLGGHGHRRLEDLLKGETITGVRHHVDIPLLAVRKR